MVNTGNHTGNEASVPPRRKKSEHTLANLRGKIMSNDHSRLFYSDSISIMNVALLPLTIHNILGSTCCILSMLSAFLQLLPPIFHMVASNATNPSMPDRSIFLASQMYTC